MNFETLLSRGLIRPAKASPVAGAGFPFGLGASGLHELAEAAYGDRAAMTGFLLAAMQPAARGAWLWVQQGAIGRDSGYVPEAALSASPARLRLTVRARNTREALWATEEAIVSGAASMVVAEVEDADFTATRRLALASGRYGVPVALLLPYSCSGPTAASARWRISPRPSAPNRYDPHAPGYPRWRAVLERCRTAPSVAGQAFDLEWNDETLSLGVARGLAAGPPAPHAAPGAPGPRRKAG